MTTDEGEVLAELEAMPEFLSAAVSGLSEESARQKGPDGSFALVEHCWHLADLEVEGFGRRIRLLLDSDAPSLSDFDGTQIARDRRYLSRSLAEGLRAFRTARESNLALLRGVPPGAWSRRGELEGLGTVELRDIPRLMREHDAAHRVEIEAWLAR